MAGARNRKRKWETKLGRMQKPGARCIMRVWFQGIGSISPQHSSPTRHPESVEATTCRLSLSRVGRNGEVQRTEPLVPLCLCRIHFSNQLSLHIISGRDSRWRLKPVHSNSYPAPNNATKSPAIECRLISYSTFEGLIQCRFLRVYSPYR